MGAPDPNLTVQTGRVKSFRRETANGQVTVGNTVLPFDSTRFYSGRPTRSPLLGETVEVILAPGGKTVLSVRVKGR